MVKKEKLKIFISYSSTTKEYAIEYYNHLKQIIYFEPWIDEYSILFGQEWEAQRDIAISESDVFIVLINQDTSTSKWQKKEIDFLLKKSKPLYVIPIIFDSKSLGENLNKFKGIYVNPNNLKKIELSEGLINVYNNIYPDNTLIKPELISSELSNQNFEIRSIKLENVKCFKSLDLSFEDNYGWIMLLGDNASGKSTILKSIGIGLSNESEAINLINLDGGNFIRRGEKEGRIIIKLIEVESAQSHTIETIIHKEVNSNKEIVRKNLNDLFDISDVFVCGYGTNRISQSVESYSEYSKISALKSIFSNDARLQNPELILLRNEDVQREIIEKNLVEILMLDPKKYGLKYSKNGMKIIGPWGVESFHSLSDGYRMTSQWVLDFISWAIYANRFIYSSNFGGILLLDEIELQLHPQWQREIVQRIRTQFPNVQIISTTHTPLIASSLADISNARLIRLKLTKEGEIEMYHINNKSLNGLTANEVLNSIAFEVHNTQNQQSITTLDRYISLKEKNSLSDEETAEFTQLRKQIIKESSIENNDAAKIIQKEITNSIDDKLKDINPDDIDIQIKSQLKKMFNTKK